MATHGIPISPAAQAALDRAAAVRDVAPADADAAMERYLKSKDAPIRRRCTRAAWIADLLAEKHGEAVADEFLRKVKAHEGPDAVERGMYVLDYVD